MESIEELAPKLITFKDEVEAVVESTGYLCIQAHDRLEKYGFEVTLSNSRKTHLIAEANIRTDKIDTDPGQAAQGRHIAHLQVPNEEERNLRELLRHRLRLVKNQTTVRNRVHALLDEHGLQIPYPSSSARRPSHG